MLQRLQAKPKKIDRIESLHWQISLTERVDLAAGALKNMGIDTSQLAPVVLICGHGTLTENNPYASSLDCGACGGHPGDVNARFAVGLMNDMAVREGLRERGYPIPSDTVFVAGLHITTTDDVVLYDADQHLSPSRRSTIQGWLKAASQGARRERHPSWLKDECAHSNEQLHREVQQRAADWSEVRPEWGLAGNAAFIAAPRSRTRRRNLGGRVFLHEYNPEVDADGAILEMILTAPVVVASWINLQYYGSVVNHQLYGSGNKVLHNVVGTFGVWEGNGGDLRTGLPLQSLHDGKTWRHEPLRLQVIVEAPRERVSRVLQANRDVRNLVENGWIQLMTMDHGSFYQYSGLTQWHAC